MTILFEYFKLSRPFIHRILCLLVKRTRDVLRNGSEWRQGNVQVTSEDCQCQSVIWVMLNDMKKKKWICDVKTSPSLVWAMSDLSWLACLSVWVYRLFVSVFIYEYSVLKKTWKKERNMKWRMDDRELYWKIGVKYYFNDSRILKIKTTSSVDRWH